MQGWCSTDESLSQFHKVKLVELNRVGIKMSLLESKQDGGQDGFRVETRLVSEEHDVCRKGRAAMMSLRDCE